MHLRRQLRHGLVVLAASLWLSGCGGLDAYRGETYQGDDATWGDTLRPEPKETPRFFFNDKSRQIEESLGL